MNFPQFWARGKSGDFLVWRWSFQSLAEAQALATQAAQQLAERFQAGEHPPKRGGYYPNRPFREQVLQEKCFCARLTPKPWRCGFHDKPGRWPWLDAKQEKRFGKWEAQYQRASAEWATCEFIRQAGNANVHAEVQALLSLHDDTTRATSKWPLA